jgi:hypothetical protein
MLGGDPNPRVFCCPAVVRLRSISRVDLWIVLGFAAGKRIRCARASPVISRFGCVTVHENVVVH